MMMKMTVIGFRERMMTCSARREERREKEPNLQEGEKKMMMMRFSNFLNLLKLLIYKNN